MHICLTVFGVRKSFRHRVYCTSRYLGVAKRSEQVLPRPRTCGCVQGLGKGSTVDHALSIDDECRVTGQMIHFEHMAQRGELGIAAHSQYDGTILAVHQISVRGDVGMEGPLPLGCLAIHKPSRSLVGKGSES